MANDLSAGDGPARGQGIPPAGEGMAAPALALAARQALEPCRNPGRAPAMAVYMQGRFAFLGVQTPARRQATLPLVRAFRGDPLAAAEALWREPEREFQYVACDLLRRHCRRLGPGDLPRLEQLVTAKSWWDTVDSLAVAVGEVVRRHPELVPRMDELIASDNLWLRRLALLHQLDWKEATDEARLFGYCLARAHETEFFIRKAMGWALRQYARVAPEAVAAFLLANRQKLSGLTRREAGKHLTGGPGGFCNGSP